MNRNNLVLIFSLVSLFLVGCSSGGSSSSDCNIKGNISYNSGEKIYHLPGDEYYSVTNIDTSEGEEWFCSAEEAEEAGFRRSLR